MERKLKDLNDKIEYLEIEKIELTQISNENQNTINSLVDEKKDLKTKNLSLEKTNISLKTDIKVLNDEKIQFGRNKDIIIKNLNLSVNELETTISELETNDHISYEMLEKEHNSRINYLKKLNSSTPKNNILEFRGNLEGKNCNTVPDRTRVFI